MRMAADHDADVDNADSSAALSTDPTSADSIVMLPIAEHMWHYAQQSDLLAKAAWEIRSFLTELAQSASITTHAIDARAKSLDSYIKKSQKVDPDGGLKYSAPGEQIRDCVAARVIVFTTDARDLFVQVLLSQTRVDERINPGAIKFNGYDSEHLVITDLTDQLVKKRYPSLTRYLTDFSGLEIQLRSVAAHAWAEYEHDVRYKPGAYQDLTSPDRSQIDQWFIEAGGMRRVMDDLFAKIEERLNSAVPGGHAPAASGIAPIDRDADEGGDSSEPEFMDPNRDEDLSQAEQEDEVDTSEGGGSPLTSDALAMLILRRFPDISIGEAEHVEQMVAQLLRLDISTIGEVESRLGDIDSDNVARLMGYVAGTTGSRRMDDELLAALEDAYVDAAPDAERRQLLSARLRRVRGKFAIYQLRTRNSSTRHFSAARAVRVLATLVATSAGVEAALVPGSIATSASDLNPSTRPRAVRTKAGVLYVATNLSRAAAEEMMRLLAQRVGPGLRVVRGGDVIFESGSANEIADA